MAETVYDKLITFNVYKQEPTVKDMTSLFNGRVGDQGVRLAVRWVQGEPGTLQEVDVINRNMFGSVHLMVGNGVPDGNGDINMDVDASGIDIDSDPANNLPHGITVFKLPQEAFPKDGFAKGYFALKDNLGNVWSSIDVWFKVKGGTPYLAAKVKYFSDEWNTFIAMAKKQNDDFANEMRAAYNQQVTDTQNALTKATANLNDLAADAGSIQALMKAQDVLYRSDLKKIQDDAEQRIASINTNLKAFKTLDDLKKTYPNGADGIFIAWDTGHKYSWIDNAWVDGGIYQKGSSIEEVEDARIWNSKLGKVKSDTLGNAIRQQFDQVEAQFNNILDTAIPDMTDQSGKIVPNRKLKLDKSLTSEVLPAQAKAVRDAITLQPERYQQPFTWNHESLPILKIEGQIPAADGVKSQVSYSYQGMNGIASIKWQGQSSLSFPKKNFTIKSDKTFTAKGGWLSTDTYVLKGNFNDFTHARNIVSAQLWGDVVRSRQWDYEAILDNDGNSLLDTDNVSLLTYRDVMPGLASAAAIDGFPIMLVVNNSFYGLYDFQIKKGRTMFGFTKDNHNQYALSCERTPQNRNDGSIHFTGPAVLDGNDYDYEYVADDIDKASARASFNYMIQQVIEATGTDYKQNLEEYLDVDSAIDYMLFTALLTASDDVTKNFLMLTYDGTKWYFSAYDMDCTFGNWQDGWLRQDPLTAAPSIDNWRHANRVMHLVCAYDADRVKERYKELRQGALSDANIYKKFTRYMSLTPIEVKNEDLKLWPTTPASNSHNFSQIFNEFKLRASVIDDQISKL